MRRKGSGDLSSRRRFPSHYPRGALRVLSLGNIYPPHAPGGGYELTWRSAVAHLREAGHSVRVLTTDHREPGVGPEAAEDPDVHRELPWYWHDHAFPKRGWRERIALERSAGAILERHLAEFRPDVLNWWGMGGMSLGLIERGAPRRAPGGGRGGRRVDGVGPARGCLAARLSPPARRRAAGRAAHRPARRGAPRERGHLALQQPGGAAPQHRAGWPLERPRVEHPGIDDALFTAAPVRDWSWRLLYLGRMDERKGVHVALDALAKLPPEATLVLQGRGDPAYVGATARARSGAGRGPAARVLSGAARAAGGRLRERRRGAVPGAVGRAMGPRPARGDGGRAAGGGHRQRRLGRVPAARGERARVLAAQLARGARRGGDQAGGGRAAARPAAGGRLPHGGPLQRAPLQRGHRESACGGRWRELARRHYPAAP